MAVVYDAILVVGFGAPERPEDVIPFLENVTRGRHVPPARLLEVEEHYAHCGGASPLNSQVRALIAALDAELDRHGIALPVFWGNRNWHPMLAATLGEMTKQHVKRALAVVLSAYGSYSSCRQYLEDIDRARAVAGSQAPTIDKVRVFYNHPDFIAANVERVREALQRLGAERRASVRLAFTAHSIPAAMARNCDYEQQLQETSRLVAESAGIDAGRWALVYQSRSGRPSDPWLEPDILDHLRELDRRGMTDVVIHPIGFLSDHMEVLYDLDVEARRVCDALGLGMVRSATVGVHPRFVAMLRELIAERVGAIPLAPRRSAGQFGPGPDACSSSCCRPLAGSVIPGSSTAGSRKECGPARSNEHA
jgi:ferrochelatase